MHVAQQLTVMHDAGFAHRDLKPSNTIWVHSTSTWTFVDYALCAPLGTLHCTLVLLLFSPAWRSDSVLVPLPRDYAVQLRANSHVHCKCFNTEITSSLAHFCASPHLSQRLTSALEKKKIHACSPCMIRMSQCV